MRFKDLSFFSGYLDVRWYADIMNKKKRIPNYFLYNSSPSGFRGPNLCILVNGKGYRRGVGGSPAWLENPI